MDMENFDGLRDSELFKGLENGDFALLADAFHVKSMTEGTTVFIENMPGESLYLIKEGAVKISKMLADGEEQTVMVLGPEEVFGELAIVGEGQRSATARIAESGRLLSLNRRDFELLCERHPRLGIKILRNIIGVFSRRIRESENDYRDMLRWSLRQGR